MGEFCAITGAERSTALAALAQSGGDLGRAVGLFFDLGAAGLAAQAVKHTHTVGGTAGTAVVSARAGGHAGEWRCATDGSLKHYCKTDAGQAGTHICAHARVIRASHWSCCGALTQSAPCGGVSVVRSAHRICLR